MATYSKFESLVQNQWIPHRYSQTFVREQTTGPERLKIAATENGTKTMLELAVVLGEPFAILYVLLTPRGGSTDGRYMSPWMNRSDMIELFDRFEEFWEQDGRHHLWLMSGPDQATLVYDQHNVIFAYGPLEDFTRILERRGFTEGRELHFPAPHCHQFHDAFDQHERDLTTLPGWQHSPLQDGDEW